MRFGDLQPGNWFRHGVRFYFKCHPMRCDQGNLGLEYDADESKPVNAMNILGGKGKWFGFDTEVSPIGTVFRDAAITLLHQ